MSFLKKLFGGGREVSLSTPSAPKPAAPKRPPQASHPRRLRMDEYLALLEAGVQTVDLDEASRERALSRARSLWPETGFGPWGSGHREVAYAVETTDGQRVLAHVTADWKDCFVIVGLNRASNAVDFFFVFDIGAEYRPLVLDCPDLPGAPLDEDTLARAVAGLREDGDSFLSLDTGKGTYMQTCRLDGGFIVEFQLATVKNHYETPGQVDAATVIELLNSYAFGRKEWVSRVDWRYLPL